MRCMRGGAISVPVPQGYPPPSSSLRAMIFHPVVCRACWCSCPYILRSRLGSLVRVSSP